MTTPLRLVEVLTAATHVLLDFDGPTCDVFSGYPATDVADQLRQLLTTQHAQHLPDDVAATGDPLHIIRRLVDLAPDLICTVDAALRAAEQQAVAVAEPTLGTAEFLAACRATGRAVAIVSNNSAAAIHAYLRQHDLTRLVAHVQGRDATDPGLMKPNPYPLYQALKLLDATPGNAVLIGDSRADIDAARAAGIRVIAYANTAGKHQTLADADALTDSIQALAAAVPR